MTEEFDDNQIVQEFETRKPRRKLRRFAFGFWISLLVIILLAVGGLLIFKTGFTYNQMKIDDPQSLIIPGMETPKPETDRTNFLVLGQRGEGDPNGGLLTDSMMIISLKRSTGQIAMISVPRDLYVKMPGANYKEKINAAYALGYEKKKEAGGMLYSKIAISQTTGLYIDHVVLINHEAFRELVDTLGGIDITLTEPFVESNQWIQGGDLGNSQFFSIQNFGVSSTTGQKIQRWVFKIPAGTSHLDGKTALYYVRARYTSSDFDRIRRQQDVMLAAKEKALSLGFLANPVKIYQVMDSLGRNIRLDLSTSDIQELITIASDVDPAKVIHKVFDTTPEGMLYSGKLPENGAYILLPVGDDFTKIQEACRNIFNQ